jgi:NADPH-dependent 2,4-dienoyl-CoA reductase/sulfur reductase-like enzyme
VGSSAAGPVRELRAPEFYRAAEIELELGRRAVAVDPAGTAVELDDGRTLSYDALLLATGGTPRRLGLPGEHLPGVFTLRSRSDAEALRTAVAASRRVVIVGAGFLGLELAGAARRLGVEVTVVAPELLPLAPPLDEQVSRWVLAQHRARGTEFRLGTMVREIHGPGQVRRVELSDGEILECGALVEAVGIRAESRYMPSRVPAADGSIRTDRRQRTAVEGVYAAGDLAAVVGEGGDARRFEHWTEAEAQGVRAARAMLGREPSASAVPFFWTEVGELTLKFVGLAPRTAAAGLRSRVRGKPEDGSFVVAYLEGVEGERDGGTSRLVAACGVGRDRELAALGELIRRGLPLEERRFSDESFDLIRALRGSSLGG